jgi:protein involved in polysaccharide export with SLBB domain
MVSSSVNASIPPQYVLSPGDQVTVYYWGDLIELTTLTLALDDKGAVSLPRGGRLVARGMSLPQFQKAVQDQLQRELSKTVKVIAALDKLKSIQVLISGEAFRPGTYAVSAVTTLFNALYAAGGPNGRGSLRDIRLVRGNKTIDVDFYDSLMSGDSKADYPLQSGDTILFGRAEKLVSIAGEVDRPAIYELKKNETLKDLVRMAEGIKPSGLSSKVHVQSLVPHQQRAVVDVDMSKTGPAADHEVYDGDIVLVEPIIDEILNKVTLAGDVKVPGVYELKPKMRVADFFNEVNQPWGEAYLERADVIRLDKDRKTTTIISINLGKALQKDPGHNIELARFDEVVVYSKWDVKFYPEKKVVIRGSVQKPGTYDRSDGMRLTDLLIKAGNVMPDTYMDRADLIGTISRATRTLRSR